MYGEMIFSAYSSYVVPEICCTLPVRSTYQVWISIELLSSVVICGSFQPLHTYFMGSSFSSATTASYKRLSTVIVNWWTLFISFSSFNFYRIQDYMGRDSAASIATCYGLDGPGVESRWGGIFRTRWDRPRGPPSLLFNEYRVFPGGKAAGRDVNHPHHLAPRLKKE
jgi:hypothetical protein